MRARRGYKIPIIPKIPIHKRNVTVVSDEENTSEYSHSPSSQHSTLESNPDEVLKQMKANKKAVNAATATTDTEEDVSSSSSSEDADDLETQHERRPTTTTTSAATTATQRQRREQRQQQAQHMQQTYATTTRAINIPVAESSNVGLSNLPRRSDVISIPTYEADGAVDMV